MRYQDSHHWISFNLSLGKLRWQTWALLGECQSKCKHLAGEILFPETAQKLHQLFLSKGALATAAIEGNTLTEEQVLQHLQGQLKLPPSQDYLQKEVENIIEECKRIAQEVQLNADVKLDVDVILRMNAAILNNLPVSPEVGPGRIRTYNVGVGRYLGAPHEDCRYLLERLCEWLNTDPELNRADEFKIAFSILKAILAHVYIAWIHPFGDGNGRTARLVEFQILMNAGAPADAVHLLSNHYNMTRAEYYRQLDQSNKGGDSGVIGFLQYAIEGLRDGLVGQLEWIKKQQWTIAWEHYVHRFFGGHENQASIRKKHLVLDLSKLSDPVPFLQVTNISPRVAVAYSKLNPITLLRDVEELVGNNLIVVEGDKIRANKESILAYLPVRKPDQSVAKPKDSVREPREDTPDLFEGK